MSAKILLQLDTDAMPSSFDAVVAIDSGVDHLLQYGGVTTDNVTPLVHGAMFTRGGDALRHTAIFVGGSDVDAAEKVATRVSECFFGPVRVSVLQDASGCNTTAAAAVLSTAKHLDLAETIVCVLGGTGPVGKRVAQMIALQGGRVHLVSRKFDRAQAAAAMINNRLSSGKVQAMSATTGSEMSACLQGCQAIIACGAAGVELVDADTLAVAGQDIKVAIDLNAVPPAGIAPINASDKAKDRSGVICYGALGVGGLKMKIHRAALQSLFERNEMVLDAEEVLAIGKKL